MSTCTLVRMDVSLALHSLGTSWVCETSGGLFEQASAARQEPQRDPQADAKHSDCSWDAPPRLHLHLPGRVVVPMRATLDELQDVGNAIGVQPRGCGQRRSE